MCRMADERPAAVVQTDNDFSILAGKKGCKNVGHQFRADSGELLALT